MPQPVAPETDPIANQSPPEQPQAGYKPTNPYAQTFFEEFKPGEKDTPGDIVMFVYNKPLIASPYEYQKKYKIHDKQPMVLVLDRKTKNPNWLCGINLHYFTYFDISHIIEMAHNRLLYHYDQIKTSNIQWTERFRTYIRGWIVPGSVRRLSFEVVQAEVNTIRQTGIRNLDTLRDLVNQNLQQRINRQQTAQQMAGAIKPIGTTPGILPTPAIGAINTPGNQ